MNDQPNFNPQAWIAANRFGRHRPLLPELAANVFNELTREQQYEVFTLLSEGAANGALLTDIWDFFTDNLELAD